MVQPSPAPGHSEPGRLERKAPRHWQRIKATLFSNWKRALWVCLLVAAGLSSYLYVSTPPTVDVAVARTIIAAETLGAVGKVQGQRVADLGLDIQGVVRGLYVKEGDRVRAGQVLLSLDRSEMDAQVDGARDAVSSAEAELARASRGPLASEIERARTELTQARLVGDARVAQAKARLSELTAGARPQEIAQAQVQLQRAKHALTKAETDLRRTRELVDQGALAQSALDQCEMDVDGARTEVAVQEQALSLLKAGARQSQIAEAKAAVAEAVASRDTGVKAAQEGLKTLISNPRPEDVAAARAKVNQARAELRRVMDARTKTDLRAPFDGIVARIPVEEGQSVSPGQQLVVLHEMTRPIITVETGEENLRVLSLGQRATVSSDAFPGRTFEATVGDLGSRVDPDRGTIQIKLHPLRGVDWLRPDMTVDVNVITRRNAARVVVPTAALTKFGGHSCVLVVRNGVAVPVPVTTGGTGPAGVAISGKVTDGDLVVREATSVTPNSHVRVGER